MKKVAYTAVIIILLGGGLYFFYKPYYHSAFASVKAYIMDESIETKKEVRMVAVGDSLSFGIGDINDNGYLGDVKHLYEKKCECDVVLEDYGIPKDTSEQLLEKLNTKEVKTSLANADYVFVNIGTNDLIKSADQHLYQLDPKKMKMGKEHYTDNLQKVASVVRKQNSDVPVYFVGLYNPYREKKADRQLSDEITDWNEILKKTVSANRNAYYVKTQGLFKEHEKQRYFSDNLHPNKNGYRLISKQVLTAMKKHRSMPDHG